MILENKNGKIIRDVQHVIIAAINQYKERE
jgi:hypothetical protein